MQADGLGNVAQDHRLHGLVALLEERDLSLHDRARHLEQCLATNLQAADQPAGFLQLCPQRRVVLRPRHQPGVALVDPEAWNRGRVDLDDPALGAAPYEHVGHDVLGWRAFECSTRPWIAAANERNGLVHGVFVHAESLRKAGEVAVRNFLQVPAGDHEREFAAGRGRLELRKLQADAFSHRAGPDAGRVQRLQEVEHAHDVLLRDRQVHAEALRDVGRRLGEVAVVVERVHERLADPHFARIEAADLELPDQVLVQVAVAVVGEFERAIVVVLGSAVARRRGGLGPRVLHLHHDFVGLRAVGLAVVSVFAGGRRLVERREVDLFFLLGLQHHVAFEGFLELRLEFEHGELQQPDRLLQLGRHRQLLAELELQGRLQHRATA